jgi:hypothetical protein
MRIFLSFLLLTGSAFGQIFPAKYHTYAEGYAEIQSLAATHPSICRIDSIGFSNRDSVTIFALKISDNAAVDEDEPAALICSGTHADEILGPEVSIGFAKNIIQKYDSGDTAAVNYINNIEIFVVPFVNPDGHIWVEQGHTAWRKDRSDNDGNGIIDSHDGVDNNRNYDFGWSIDAGDSVTSPDSLMYKGPYAFSEAENRAIAAFGQKYKPLVALDYHSPSYGRSEVAYYNWYWYSSQGGHGYAPDESMMGEICRQYASRIIDDPGDSCYEARRGLVNKGDFKTYFYGNFGSIAFSVEISDTTIQDTSMADGIVARHLPGEYYLMQRILGPGVTGIIRDSLTLAPLTAEVQVLERINEDINPRYSRPDYGRYRRVLTAGNYTLRFIKSGYYSRDISVTVGSGAPTVTNVKLYPIDQPQPPAAPLLVSPSNGGAVYSTPTTFIWRSSATATRYIIEIARDSLFTTIFAQDSNRVDTTYQNSTPFVAGDYFWRVTASNALGNSPRSQSFKFKVIFAPATPVLIAPVNNSTFDTTVVSFVWHKSATATRYIIEIARDSLFMTIFAQDSNRVDTTYHNSIPFVAGDYFWRVTASNTAGNSPRSQSLKFKVIFAPAAPLLIAPINDTTFDTAVVSFVWHKSTGATSYVIEIDNDSLFSSPLEIDSALADTSYTNSVPFVSGHYYWRVTAHNNAGYSGRSQKASFTIEINTISYIPGDVNDDHEIRGSDVTYLVRYFKGLGPPPPIIVSGFYPGADANGDCSNRGSDVIYLVNYFKGGNPPIDGQCF